MTASIATAALLVAALVHIDTESPTALRIGVGWEVLAMRGYLVG